VQGPFDIAADLDTPVSAFLKLAPFRPRFLLESVVGGANVGRYSFIGFGDATELVIDEPPEDRESLLDQLRDALAAAPRPGPAVEGLPFEGGLVGYFGYDLVRCFERLPARAEPREGEPAGAWVPAESLLVFDHATRRCAVLHAGDERARRNVRRDVVMALRGAIPDRSSDPAARGGFRRGAYSSPRPSLSREAFIEGVRKVREHIYEGDIFQLVLSARFEGECHLDPFQVYRALRLLNPSPYMYYLDVAGMQIVGSSPEALVRVSGREAELRPIAGTRPRGATPEEDRRHEEELLADPKEAAEHVMLVDLARNDVGRVAVPGTVRVDPYRVIERYSHVMHIVSGVLGELPEDIDPFELFAACFPAGTVTGAPKVRAMELIDGLEPVRRGPYAGTVGYFGHGGTMDQAIAIRTVVFRGGRYAYQSGAGVVADSVPESEHAEILAKAAAMESALAFAEAGL